jgi:hypothetical protein
VAGIDTPQEHNIFQYRPDIKRPVPPPDRPRQEPEPSIGDLYNDRKAILDGALDTDEDIDELQDLIEEQGSGLIITPIDQPGLEWALQQLGGTEIDWDMYNKAKNLLRNAAIASMCVDPVQLVFAEGSPQGPLIPRVKTKTPDCEEASDPDLFNFSGFPLDDMIGLDSAMDQFDQMSLYRTLLMTWWGMIIFAMRVLLRLVEKAIYMLGGGKIGKALDKITFGIFGKLNPIVKPFKMIAAFLRRLICWAERKVFGRMLSDFCRDFKSEEPAGIDDDVPDPEGEAGRKYCFELDNEGNPIDITNDENKICIEDDTGTEPPEGEGCPVNIPPECVKAAQMIMDAVKAWTLEADDTHGDVNPNAILIDLALTPVIDAQEAGKFMLTSTDNSILSDKLSNNTAKRSFARNRYQHPLVQSYVDIVKPARVTYAEAEEDPTSNLRNRDC